VDRLDALALLRTEIAAEQAVLDGAETALAAQGAEIASLIDARTAELSRLRADSAERTEAARALAAQAETLRELIAAIEERSGDFEPAPGGRLAAIPTPRLKPPRDQIGARPPPFVPPTGRFADARGALSPPAAGEVVAGFGESHGGAISEGLWLRTRRGALVTSPFDARIEHAAEFGGYGPLLLLSVGDDYHIVLAGLEVLYGVEGQTVLAGEPVGEMSDAPGAAPELYVQIRKEGQPIDPAPWWRRGE
jgi:septal ring factor EnvC (AmiA/AmiB activator)